MAFDIIKEISRDQVVVLLIPSVTYGETTLSIPKSLKGKSVCYVTINKTAESLIESLKRKKISTKETFFVDAISSSIKKTPKVAGNIFYVSSPGALTELSLVIDKLLQHNFDYLIFDSLSNLLIYEKSGPVTKFVFSLVNKIRQTDTTAIFYALSTQSKDQLIQEAGMFVDKVIEVDAK